MRLSSIEIKKQEFKKSFKGYDISEVEAYLDTVANELEKMFRDNESLKERIAELEKLNEELRNETQVYRDNEKTFQKAIVKSQDLSEEVLHNANKRAELILKEAEIIASKAKIQAQEDILHLKQELEDLRMKNENIIEDIRAYLIEKLNSIEEYNKNRKIIRLDSKISALKDISQDEPDNLHDSDDLSMDRST
jgi:cell division initiation protein